MMRSSALAKTGSPGFGVSPAGPSSTARTCGGTAIFQRASTASASAAVVGSGTVGPEAISEGSSPRHVGDAERQRARRMEARGEPAALDARQVLSDRVDVGDRRAGGEQRLGQRLLVGDVEALGAARSSWPSRRRRRARARDRRARPPRQAPARRRCRQARLRRARDGPPRPADAAERPPVAVARHADADEALRLDQAAVEVVRARTPPPCAPPTCRRRARGAGRVGGGGQMRRQADRGCARATAASNIVRQSSRGFMRRAAAGRR